MPYRFAAPPETLPPIDATAVDAAVRGGFRGMRFPAPLEARFEQETGPDRARDIALRSLLGLLLFNIFLFSDLALMPDAFALAVLLRLGVFTPLALAVILFMRTVPQPAIRECLQALVVVLSATVPPLLILNSDSPLREAGHHGMLLVVLFATMIQRIRFWYALAAVAVITVLYFRVLLALPMVPPAAVVAYGMVFLGTCVFSLVASYNLEHEQRMTYLFRLRDAATNRELEDISRHDPLTGLGNRRALAILFDDLARTAEGEEIAVLLADIDHFKAYNDTLGHQAGDACLKQVADIITGSLRRHGDAAFRFGGEEFLMVLRRTSPADAHFIAERMRRAIEDAAIPHPAAPAGRVTASFGIAVTLVSPGLTPEDPVSGADAALYAAKHAGRNQVWPRPATGRAVADPEDRLFPDAQHRDLLRG